MSTPYLRQALLAGNTEVPRVTQPSVHGTVRRNAVGVLESFLAPCDLVLETEGMSGIPVTVAFSAGTSELADIVATINAALSAGPWGIASDVDGCVSIASSGVGETGTGPAFVRIHPAVNDYDLDGLPDDAARMLGLATYPDPAATVTAGDTDSAPIRALTQANPTGTRFLAYGEDRTSQAFNRALAQLSENADATYYALAQQTIVPVVLTVNTAVSAWASRLILDPTTGFVDQIDLSNLAVVDPALAGRLFVGGLDRESTLREIAQFWSLTDSADREMLVYDATRGEPYRILRVGAVTRGQRGLTRPDFLDEDTGPTPATRLLDTGGVGADGLNALGVDRVRISAEGITAVARGMEITCAGLTDVTGFVAQGVRAGDVAVIAGASAAIPYSNNGTYLVDAVLGDQTLLLRPLNDTNVRPLNQETAGSYGTLTVTTGGAWEDGLFVSFDPPLPRLPEDGIFKLVVGIERSVLHPRRDEDESGYNDGLVVPRLADPRGGGDTIRRLEQTHTLQGAYQSFGASPAGGTLLLERPLTLAGGTHVSLSAGTVVRGPIVNGTVEAGVLVAPSDASGAHPDTFVRADVGRIARLLAASPRVAASDYVITEWIDGAHVRLAPVGPTELVPALTLASVSYAILDDAVSDFPAQLLLRSADETNDAAPVALVRAGIVFQRDSEDTGSTDPAAGGQSLVHLERVRLVRDAAGVTQNVSLIGVTGAALSGSTTALTLGISLLDTSNVFALDAIGARATPAPGSPATVLRILNGTGAGYYLIRSLLSTGGVELSGLDGGDVTGIIAGAGMVCALYNVAVGVNQVVAGAYGGTDHRTVAFRVFSDAYAQDELSTAALSVGWVGPGAGIIAVLNDADFAAYDRGDAADGYLLDATLYVPAHGIHLSLTAAETGDLARRSARGLLVDVDSNALDFALDSIGFGSPARTGWAGWFSQVGEDPALLVTKMSARATSGEAPVDLGTFSSTAALVVAYDGESLKGSAALEVVGGIFQRDASRVFGLSADRGAGIYTQNGVTSGMWNVPGATDYLRSRERPRLGMPAQIAPATWDEGAIPVQVTAPDYTRTKVPHRGMVTFPEDTFSAPYGQWVGQAVWLETVGVQFEIVDFVEEDDGRQTAVVSRTAGLNLTAAADTAYVLGHRWELGHVDVADYMRIGTLTASDSLDLWQLPYLTLGTDPADAVDRAGAPYLGTTSLAVERSLSPLSPSPSTVGDTLSDWAYITELPNLAVTATAYATASEFPTGKIGTFQHGRAQDTADPRTPFPNKGVFTGNDGERDSSVGGSFLVDDLVVRFVSGGAGVTAQWYEAYGGCLQVWKGFNTSAPDAVVRLWLRPVVDVAPDLVALKGVMRIAQDSPGTRTVVMALRYADGTLVLPSFTASMTMSGDSGRPIEVSEAFTYVSSSPTPDAFWAGAAARGPMYLTLDVPVSDNDIYPNRGFYLLDFRVEQVAKPVRMTTVEVPGVLRVGSLRTASPLKGGQTVAPPEAALLNAEDYGTLAEDVPGRPSGYEQIGGGQEGRGVGLVYNASGSGTPAWFRPTLTEGSFFRKGLHSAAIVFNHPFFDPLFYARYAPATAPADAISCGPTGFLLPIDPPHGARLTGLQLSMSTRYTLLKTGSGGSWYAVPQAFRNRPSFGGGRLLSDLSRYALWDEHRGYYVTLYRYNALPFGVRDSVRTGHSAAEHGFAEPIWRRPLEITTGGYELSGGSTEYRGAEYFHFMNEQLFYKEGPTVVNQYGPIDESALTVDRRHYSYFVAVEFYAGHRSIDAVTTDADNRVTDAYLDAVAGDRALMDIGFGDAFFERMLPSPLDLTSSLHTYGFVPGAAKFRGLRVTWATDRPLHGGWG